MKQTFEQAGYSYVQNLGNGQHELKNNNTGEHEVFFANKNHASWGLIFKNTHLEFGYTKFKD